MALNSTSSASFDAELGQLWLDSASEVVWGYVGRQLTPLPAGPLDPPVTRTVRARGRRTIRIPDARELVSVVADGVTLTEDQYELFGEDDQPQYGMQLAISARRVVLTGRFGFSAVPACAKSATLAIASRFYHERNARGSDQVIDPTGGAQAYFKGLAASTVVQLNALRVVSV